MAIERRAFMNLDQLQYLTLRGNKLETIEDEAFQVSEFLLYCFLLNLFESFGFGFFFSFSLSIPRNEYFSFRNTHERIYIRMTAFLAIYTRTL